MRNIVYILIYPYAKLKYRIKIEKFKETKKRPHLILYNHQTPFDQFFVGMCFSGAVYYLATEDIFSNGFTSTLIKKLVAPIPIKKQTLDIKAIKNCIKVAREGGTIAIAPEGNRTYSGKTEYMNPSIAQLARKLGMPIALYRIEGGYGAEPRWSDVVRKGRIHAYVARVIEPAEYSELSDGELFEIIRDGLYVNEAKADCEFYHKKSAEYIERLLYVCPFCGLSEFESHDDSFICRKCKRKITYKPTKELEGENFELPFRFVNDWYEYQKNFIRELDFSKYSGDVLYKDEAMLSDVASGRKKEILRDIAEIRLYSDRITVDEGRPDEIVIPFEEISVAAVLGRNKLNIYHGDRVYQIKGNKRFNAIKYVHIFYAQKNLKETGTDGKFLGL